MSEYITSACVADYCGVSRRSITRWRKRCNDPFPDPERLAPGPQLHYNKSTVASWMSRNYPQASTCNGEQHGEA